MEILNIFLSIWQSIWTYVGIGIIVLYILGAIIAGLSPVVKTIFSTDPKKSNALKEAMVYYYLPESIIKIRSTVKVAVVYDASNKIMPELSQIIEQCFAVTTENIADTRDLLCLNYNPNILSADEIKFNVNSKGLLENVNITTDDRTSEIISKLAEAPLFMLPELLETKRRFRKLVTEEPETEKPLYVKIKEFSADFVIKAASLYSSEKHIEWTIIIENELNIKGDSLIIKEAYDFSSKDNIAKPELKSFIKRSSSETVLETKISGILTRPLKNIELIINYHTKYINTIPEMIEKVKTVRVETAKKEIIDITIADPSQLISIPIKRTAFVKRVNNIGIHDGIIISNEINNPSSLEGFISIPINIAKAIVSIPGQLIKFRIDHTTQLGELEQAKLKYEQSIQDSKKYELTKDKEIEAIKKELEQLKAKANTGH